MEDIKTIHELDENLNQRIIIINDKPELDVITSSKKEQSYYHCNYLKKYLESAYLEDQTLQVIRPKISVADGIVTANIIYYLLKHYNDIAFIETTKDHSKERYAILYLPDEISKSQYEFMKEKLGSHMNKFSSILIQGGLQNKNGLPEATIYEEFEKNNIEKIWKLLKDIVKEEKRK